MNGWSCTLKQVVQYKIIPRSNEDAKAWKEKTEAKEERKSIFCSHVSELMTNCFVLLARARALQSLRGIDWRARGCRWFLLCCCNSSRNHAAEDEKEEKASIWKNKVKRGDTDWCSCMLFPFKIYFFSQHPCRSGDFLAPLLFLAFCFLHESGIYAHFGYWRGERIFLFLLGVMRLFLFFNNFVNFKIFPIFF